ncbi:hypothetical protein NCLIV_020850 [Neospora caninum Liverpool]|uniref:Transmembrane protein n=1 Tax=Neospora caninum (strain Liverpool) TaxID=572307 RepID=F0VF04_NEOCL|nr:hypothetical protein NCLIV_020850 [Neospora caninum Liverpool]CBZ52298.1 hypothetical protein NCLIV_020850 [Neospora caninum Liverpool]|eukprot:XP_003882330.1 hypothetical protein NCLIV_020850 [Neospora caninum Liverpool]
MAGGALDWTGAGLVLSAFAVFTLSLFLFVFYKVSRPSAPHKPPGADVLLLSLSLLQSLVSVVFYFLSDTHLLVLLTRTLKCFQSALVCRFFLLLSSRPFLHRQASHSPSLPSSRSSSLSSRSTFPSRSSSRSASLSSTLASSLSSLPASSSARRPWDHDPLPASPRFPSGHAAVAHDSAPGGPSALRFPARASSPASPAFPGAHLQGDTPPLWSAVEDAQRLATLQSARGEPSLRFIGGRYLPVSPAEASPVRGQLRPLRAPFCAFANAPQPALPERRGVLSRVASFFSNLRAESAELCKLARGATDAPVSSSSPLPARLVPDPSDAGDPRGVHCPTARKVFAPVRLLKTVSCLLLLLPFACFFAALPLLSKVKHACADRAWILISGLWTFVAGVSAVAGVGVYRHLDPRREAATQSGRERQAEAPAPREEGRTPPTRQLEESDENGGGCDRRRKSRGRYVPLQAARNWKSQGSRDALLETRQATAEGAASEEEQAETRNGARRTSRDIDEGRRSGLFAHAGTHAAARAESELCILGGASGDAFAEVSSRSGTRSRESVDGEEDEEGVPEGCREKATKGNTQQMPDGNISCTNASRFHQSATAAEVYGQSIFNDDFDETCQFPDFVDACDDDFVIELGGNLNSGFRFPRLETEPSRVSPDGVPAAEDGDGVTYVPHWCIFYVCYWVERAMYKPICRQWDVTLSEASFLGAARSSRLHASAEEIKSRSVSRVTQPTASSATRGGVAGRGVEASRSALLAPTSEAVLVDARHPAVCVMMR